MDTPQVDKWCQQYIVCRDWLKAQKKEYEERIKQTKQDMEVLAGLLQSFLDSSGVESAATKSGTVYSTTKYSASLADPKAFMDFVIENKQFDLLERHANVLTVREYMKEHHIQPPGVNLSAVKTVGVRRA